MGGYRYLTVVLVFFLHMTTAARFSKLSLAILVAAAALAAMLFGGGVRQAEAAPVNCPKFKVLHNDRIGKLKLPKGSYNVTVLNGDKLSCAQSSKLFAKFLQDWDGVLPKPWIIQVNKKTFRRGKGSDIGFRVSKSSGGGSGGGKTPRSCPGYFRVLHNDSIGSFKVPKGQYRITLVGPRKINCATASKRFAEFLLDYDGVLPKPWVLNQQDGDLHPRQDRKGRLQHQPRLRSFAEPEQEQEGRALPGTFRVLNNDRIGKLILPKGPYYIKVGNGLACSGASNFFRQFLNRTDGRLPSPGS